MGLTENQWNDAVEEAVMTSTREQGLPVTVVDESVLERVATIFGTPPGGSRSVAA